MLGYLCVLLMVKAVVVLLSWDVRLTFVYCWIVKAVVVPLVGCRLPLCIFDQSCSSTALGGC